MLLTEVVTKEKARLLKQAFGIDTVEQAHKLSDAQLLSVFGIGRIFIQRLRNIEVKNYAPKVATEQMHFMVTIDYNKTKHTRTDLPFYLRKVVIEIDSIWQHAVEEFLDEHYADEQALGIVRIVRVSATGTEVIR